MSCSNSSASSTENAGNASIVAGCTNATSPLGSTEFRRTRDLLVFSELAYDSSDSKYSMTWSGVGSRGSRLEGRGLRRGRGVRGSSWSSSSGVLRGVGRSGWVLLLVPLASGHPLMLGCGSSWAGYCLGDGEDGEDEDGAASSVMASCGRGGACGQTHMCVWTTRVLLLPACIRLWLLVLVCAVFCIACFGCGGV